MFIVKFEILKSLLTSSEVTDLERKIKISICIWPTMDQKINIDALFMKLNAIATKNVEIIMLRINIPSPFASLDAPNWELEVVGDEVEELSETIMQFPDVKVKPGCQTSQVDPLEEVHFWHFATEQLTTVSFISFWTGPVDDEIAELTLKINWVSASTEGVEILKSPVLESMETQDGAVINS